MATRSSILNVADQAQGVIPYLRSLDAELIWTPGRNSKSGIDWSKNGLTPTAQNPGDLTLSTAPYPPIIGGAPVCEFGGTNGYIDFGDEAGLEFTTAFTAIVLQKLPDWSAGYSVGVIGKYNTTTDDREWTIAQRGNLGGNPMNVNFGDPGNGTFESLRGWNMSRFSLDEWQVMVVVYDAGSVSMYLDGIDLGSADWSSRTVPSTLYNGSANFNIGRSDGYYEYLSGSIALAAVLGTALTEGEIQAVTELILAGA